MTFTSVSPEEFSALMHQEDSFVIRAPISWNKVLEGTDLVMEQGDINDYNASLPAKKTTRILVYCRRGNASRVICQQLIDAGYTNVINLEGGMYNLLGIRE